MKNQKAKKSLDERLAALEVQHIVTTAALQGVNSRLDSLALRLDRIEANLREFHYELAQHDSWLRWKGFSRGLGRGKPFPSPQQLRLFRNSGGSSPAPENM